VVGESVQQGGFVLHALVGEGADGLEGHCDCGYRTAALVLSCGKVAARTLASIVCVAIDGFVIVVVFVLWMRGYIEFVWVLCGGESRK
jgi:hypothetical protein